MSVKLGLVVLVRGNVFLIVCKVLMMAGSDLLMLRFYLRHLIGRIRVKLFRLGNFFVHFWL